ncbi:hypothetical protein PUN28_018519 [Cardiocondyla obscurior]|uniref:Uncharacterized protein n=1 Tax=Cardiocondyla obscurior TaxID=286306 RepID=A0AAW2EE73_9HYME
MQTNADKLLRSALINYKKITNSSPPKLHVIKKIPCVHIGLCQPICDKIKQNCIVFSPPRKVLSVEKKKKKLASVDNDTSLGISSRQNIVDINILFNGKSKSYERLYRFVITQDIILSPGKRFRKKGQCVLIQKTNANFILFYYYKIIYSIYVSVRFRCITRHTIDQVLCVGVFFKLQNKL